MAQPGGISLGLRCAEHFGQKLPDCRRLHDLLDGASVAGRTNTSELEAGSPDHVGPFSFNPNARSTDAFRAHPLLRVLVGNQEVPFRIETAEFELQFVADWVG